MQLSKMLVSCFSCEPVSSFHPIVGRLQFRKRTRKVASIKRSDLVLAELLADMKLPHRVIPRYTRKHKCALRFVTMHSAVHRATKSFAFPQNVSEKLVAGLPQDNANLGDMAALLNESRQLFPASFSRLVFSLPVLAIDVSEYSLETRCSVARVSS